MIIKNKSAVLEFFNIISDLTYGNLREKINNINETVWFGILMARKKYIKNNHNVNIPQTLPLQKYVIRNFDNFIKKLERTKFDKFTDKDNNIIPIDSLALYVSLNPRNIKNATKKLGKEIIELSFDNDIDKMRRLDQITYQCYHKSPLKCGRCVIDIDINYDKDDRKNIELNVTDVIIRYLISVFRNNSLKMIVKTCGGLHVYIDLIKLNKNENKYLFNKFTDSLIDYLSMYKKDVFVKEIEIDTDPLVVVPGTMQGGYEVKIVWRDGEYVGN